MILSMTRFFDSKKSQSLLTALICCLWTVGAQGALNAKTQLKQAYVHADRGRNGSALGVLAKVKTKDQQLKDDIALAQGRILFNQGEYAKSYKAYKKISKNSENWLASVEERAWALIYLGKANQALADSHTLMSPLFRKVVSPEAYFLSAFAAYQVCDFTRVFKIIDQFKKVSRKKIMNLESGQQTRHSRKAHWELEHYSDVIQHLSLVEADSIQRMYLDKSLQGQRGQAGPEQKVGKYDLQFPYEENDVWIDEIDQLQVNAKNCPQPVRKVVSK